MTTGELASRSTGTASSDWAAARIVASGSVPTRIVTAACELSIVMPCLNEAETLGVCIEKAKAFLSRTAIVGEVVVADNGSTDGSQNIARNGGARVVDVIQPGYGAALIGGINAARGRFVIMGDSDDSYDFSALDAFIAKLRDGDELVMGNRFRGGIAPGAMPTLHRWLGNPVLTAIGRLFFRSPVADFHCGLRGFDRAAIVKLDLQSPGMEFASEMVVKATLQGLRIAEVPTKLAPDGRSRPPHLRSWRDGWRHLRFLLMYAPRWLFLYPGLALILCGLTVMAAVLPGPLQIGSVIFDVHTLLFGMAAILVGSQTALFFLLIKRFAANERLLPSGPGFHVYRRVASLERTVLAGAAFTLAGLIGSAWAVVRWGNADFGELAYDWMMRLVIPSVTLLGVGIQLILAGFFAGILDLKRQHEGST